MPTDAELKDAFKKKASVAYETYFPVKTLRELGFFRAQCKTCSRHYWSQDRTQRVCGDPSCSGGFRFIGTPHGNPLTYIGTWKKFAEIHQRLGYTPIKRYPVIARWNPTTDFTIASIAAFQPYVVSGEVAPPANPLVIPQFSLRFGDVDNVGITGHFCCFVMMGQHAFVSPKDYDINSYIKHHLTWLTEGMGLKLSELTIHEDGWAGGGNFGPCMEFFAYGLEISNQVYMQFEATETGSRELPIKVLDMGQGMERVAWFTQGMATAYDATFPDVLKKLTRATGVHLDQDLLKRFVPLSPYLNVGEVTNLDDAWENVAAKLNTDVDELRSRIEPIAALYAIAEHARALLVAITDGGLPSNVGGMYNLRVILRRALGFLDAYGWKVDLADVCDWHAAELKPLFPELSEQLANVRKIIGVEKEKYQATMTKSRELAKKLATKDVTTDDLIDVYDSQGIPPELVRLEAKALGKQISIPDNFYALVAKRHEQKEQEHATIKEHKLELPELPATKALYFDDWKLREFTGKVLWMNGSHVVLDQTAFYPTSGGQLHDIGTLNGIPVTDVFKQGSVIVHALASAPMFKKGETVNGLIDLQRRTQLAQHHTSTHIITATARRVLGPHVNQAGAKKDIDKAHIDLTHYEPINDQQLKKIEDEANEVVAKGLTVRKTFLPRGEAEKKYGVAIYQGGAVPGKQLRIVEIDGLDVEACGGTHLNNTREAELIKIVKATKVKDGIVRIVFTAGAAARALTKQDEAIVTEAAKLLACKPNQMPGRAAELFDRWKQSKKGKTVDSQLTSTAIFEGDVLAKTAEILQTQPEHIVKTIQRFLHDIQLKK